MWPGLIALGSAARARQIAKRTKPRWVFLIINTLCQRALNTNVQFAVQDLDPRICYANEYMRAVLNLTIPRSAREARIELRNFAFGPVFARLIRQT